MSRLWERLGCARSRRTRADRRWGRRRFKRENWARGRREGCLRHQLRECGELLLQGRDLGRQLAERGEQSEQVLGQSRRLLWQRWRSKGRQLLGESSQAAM